MINDWMQKNIGFLRQDIRPEARIPEIL